MVYLPAGTAASDGAITNNKTQYIYKQINNNKEIEIQTKFM
jgi:hypothetical protein